MPLELRRKLEVGGPFFFLVGDSKLLLDQLKTKNQRPTNF